MSAAGSGAASLDFAPWFDTLREAQTRLALQTRAEKDRALRSVMERLAASKEEILAANARDLRRAREGGMKEALVDRLSLDGGRIDGMIDGIGAVAALDDPAGKAESWTLPNGLFVERLTVPLGVAAIIYESRPNVTIEAWSLAYKAGCAILLRGSGAARESNRAIVAAIKAGLEKGGIPGAVELCPGESHAEVDAILQARGKIDVVLPRGGHDLIRHVVENAKIPVIETGEGNCHIYAGPDFGVEAAVKIILNAKLQKPGACNAVETLIVHRDAAPPLLPPLAEALAGKAELRCDARARAIIEKDGVPPGLVLRSAEEADWETEFLDYILAVKTVDSLEEAITHINRYGTKHSEAILTGDLAAAEEFCRRVDAACVYVNASTRFTDGGEFGFGAELGISTQKFHARGPMGLSALTTIKYRVRGTGQIRE